MVFIPFIEDCQHSKFGNSLPQILLHFVVSNIRDHFPCLLLNIEGKHIVKISIFVVDATKNKEIISIDAAAVASPGSHAPIRREFVNNVVVQVYFKYFVSECFLASIAYRNLATKNHMMLFVGMDCGASDKIYAFWLRCLLPTIFVQIVHGHLDILISSSIVKNVIVFHQNKAVFSNLRFPVQSVLFIQLLIEIQDELFWPVGL